ncbi:MAG: hypothetical protein KAJ46_02685 [Sedimentisphaerales bacterium]|nr:hypothetical protein [Sedimentisphaerales bacterium]
MISADDIYKLIKKLQVEPGADMDVKVHSRITKTLEEWEKTKPAFVEPNIWRKIMKSKITKLATAAVIIIAVMIGINQFGDSIGGGSVVWADVIEQISEFRPYVCKMTFKYDGDRPNNTYTVMYMTLSRRREIRDQGKLIQVFDMSQRPVSILTLYPDRKFARETLLLDRGPLKDPDMLRIIAGRQNGTEEDLGLDKINGKTVRVFHSPDQHNEFTVWVDVETSLPERVEIQQPTSNRIIIMEEFEFDVEFDESLFDTTAPEDYAVDRIERAGRESFIKQKDLSKKADFEAYVLSTRPAWAKEPRIMEVSNVMGVGDDIYMTFAIADDGRHVVLMQSQMMSKMLLSKIRTGKLVYSSSNGLKVYRGGPEKWYSNILLQSAGNVLPDNPSPDRTGCAIESPSGMVILIAVNGSITDDELFNIADSLVPSKEYIGK